MSNLSTTGRRKNGDGTEPKWDEARQQYVVQLTMKGKRRTVRDATEAGLRKKVQALATDAERGRLPKAIGRLTLRRYLRDWHVGAKQDCERRATTLRGYEVNIRHIEQTQIAGKHLVDVGPQDVLAMLRELRMTGLSERTVTYIHATLRVALGDAVELELLARNPAQVSRRKGRKRGAQQPKKRVLVLSMAEVDALRSALADERLGALFLVAVTCGLRRGELLGLRWRDINLDRRRMFVTHQLAEQSEDGPRRLDFATVKTDGSERVVPLPDEVVRVLTSHKDRQQFERQNALNLWQDRDLVFCTEFGGGLETTTLYRVWDRVRKAAGLTCRLHDLRHTTVAILLNQGVSLFDISKILGHASYAFTANVYGHLLPESRHTADAMDAALAALAVRIRHESQ